MDEIVINQLAKTTKALVENLNIRMDNILKKFRQTQGYDIFSDERIAFMLDDLIDLASAINVIQAENQSVYLGELTEKINILCNSMELGDKFLFSDILEFEIRPLLDHWIDIL